MPRVKSSQRLAGETRTPEIESAPIMPMNGFEDANSLEMGPLKDIPLSKRVYVHTRYKYFQN